MKDIYSQIFRNAITYHRNRIRFLCSLAKGDLRASMLAKARIEANEIKETLRIWRVSYAC